MSLLVMITPLGRMLYNPNGAVSSIGLLGVGFILIEIIFWYFFKQPQPEINTISMIIGCFNLSAGMIMLLLGFADRNQK
jgi:hypothetical protein